ncbi:MULTISPECIES: hypothetical protein [unclassified Streptomyces]|uniref:hypothetical protein n=1 Tax=unclassified Streptomyces TaxID=2593676 RepID=UPI00381CAA94
MTPAVARTRALLDTPPPGVIPGQLDLTRSDMTELDTILTAGLHWLYETEQPADAWQEGHGLPLRAPVTNRRYSFIPANDRRRVVVAVDVATIEWIDNGPNEHKTPANPLEPGELEALAAALRALGFEVTSTWNGHPQTTGSVGLARTAHPSLLAAFDRYRAGCLTHPQRGLFCDCDAWRAGFDRIVRPELLPA